MSDGSSAPYDGEEARDWPEDFSHENGNYINRCVRCEQSFTGHKRRVVCKLCAGSEPRLDAAATPISNKHIGYFTAHRHVMPIFEDLVLLERRLNEALRERERAMAESLERGRELFLLREQLTTEHHEVDRLTQKSSDLWNQLEELKKTLVNETGTSSQRRRLPVCPICQAPLIEGECSHNSLHTLNP